MLVLTRQREQSIIIGDHIEITVVDVRGDKVRLGIAAPREVPVHRKEVYQDIHGVKGARGPEAAGGAEAAAHVGAVPAESADPFMKAALEKAQRGLAEGGLPIGSVLVRDGKIIAAGHNQRVQRSDPMAHAEIDCLTRAGRQHTYRDTVLYSTLMPCYLCSGAVIQFGIPKVVVGESANFRGGADMLRQKGVEVVDLKDAACIKLMGDFIRGHPELWNEDIGK